MLEAATPGTSGALYCEYEAVTPNMAKRIRAATGVDVRGYVHSIDESAVRHARRRHGSRGEADRSVTDADLELLPAIVGNPDAISVAPAHPRKPDKLAAFEFRRRFGGDWLVVAEVRTGAKQLALLSMRKGKAAGT